MKEPRFVFLVGAARSGTKFLRDTLGASQDVAVVPFDVNYLWRHGNEKLPHDALEPDMISDADAAHIRRAITRLALKNGPQDPSIIVEKTVSNTLRMPAIRRIFPNASFILLERNGLDVVASSMRQWTEPDSQHLRAKLRYFPLTEWRYALWFLGNQVSRSSGPPIWGPRYPDIEQDLETNGLAVTCARQWAACVEASRSAADSSDTRLVNYGLLQDFDAQLADVLDWLELDGTSAIAAALKTKFRLQHSWPGPISESEQALVRDIVGAVDPQSLQSPYDG